MHRVCVPVCVLFACIYRHCAKFCLHGIFTTVCLYLRCGMLTNTHAHTPCNQQTPLHPVSVCMHYVLGIASVSLCWSRQSWACPTDHHKEEETEELGQQRQQQRGHHYGQETQPSHQLQPLQSGTCKHQLGLPLFFTFFLWLNMYVLKIRTDGPNGIAAWIIFCNVRWSKHRRNPWSL